jgi:uncharacterized membrane protein YuzA (DUF378 family)
MGGIAMTTPTSPSTQHRLDEGRARLVQGLAAAVGALFLIIGIAGFFVTGFDDFAEHTDETLLGFGVNPLHNLVHILIGLAGLVLARTLSEARAFGWLLVVGYGATLVYGLIVADDTEDNLLNLNQADNWLHLAAVIAGLVIALLPVRRRDGLDAGPRTTPRRPAA